ncbi:45151_t:CDS:2, partial [Gigaspora margarita]
MSFLYQQRGPWVTRACTNCQRKHAKCSGGTTCKCCTQRPKKNGKHQEQVYVLYDAENDIDGTSMLSSIKSSAFQE